MADAAAGSGGGAALAAPIGAITIEIARRGVTDGFSPGWPARPGAAAAISPALVVGGLLPVAGSPAPRARLSLTGTVLLRFLGIAGSLAGWWSDAELARTPSARASYGTVSRMAANPYGIVSTLPIGAALVATAVGRGGRGTTTPPVVGVSGSIVAGVRFLRGLARAGRHVVTARVLRWLGGWRGRWP